jgi:hypothetical protein
VAGRIEPAFPNGTYRRGVAAAEAFRRQKG